MNTNSIRLAVAALFVSLAASNSIAASGGEPHAEAKRLFDDVAWLADDAQAGRRAGTEDAKRCASWIQSRLESLGLEPAGENGFEQPFEVGLPAFDGGHSWFEISGQRVADPKLVAPVFCAEGPDVVGRLVFRGWGIDESSMDWNDYAEGDSNGAIVVVARGLPDTKIAAKGRKPAPTTGTKDEIAAATNFGSSGSIFTKVMTAKRHGAAAVILLSDPTNPDEKIRFDATHSSRSGIPVLFVARDVMLAKLGVADANAFQASLSTGASPESILSSTKLPTARLFADVQRPKGVAYNVLGRLKGKSSERYVLVGAHYDHLGHGESSSLDPKGGGQIHHGADDNASGTAAVLEMARLLAGGPKPDCDVVFALWSGEELGLLGSEHWAAEPTLPLDKLRCNLNLDMVGRAANGKLQVLGVGTAAPFEAWLQKDEKELGLELALGKSGQGIGGSDHQTFLKRKIPAVHFFSGVHADYHKPSDTSDKFEAAGAAKVTDLGVALLRQMCGAGSIAFIEPPAEKGEGRRPTNTWRAWFGSMPEYAFEGPGVRLAGTSAGSPAEKAGLIARDVLTGLGDVKIATIDDFMYALQLYKPGDVVEARYVRDGKPEAVRVTLATREAQ